MNLSNGFYRPLSILLTTLMTGSILTLFLNWMLFMDPTTKIPVFNDLSEIEKSLEANLEGHVQALGSEIGERNMWLPKQMAATVDYINKNWSAQGYEVKKQEYTVEGVSAQNLAIELKGRQQPDKIIIVGAHYDSVQGSPGANDNGSGVAAILELSRLFRQRRPEKSVRFVAFANEEPPFFLSRNMGSRAYAASARQQNEQIIAMLSIETIGYYSDRPGSQSYPFPFGFVYPNTADFIGFVGNLSSRNLVKQALDSFRRHTPFPAQGVAAPGWMPGIGWSDHWSFWREGYPAIMVTDTALYRYDYYHTSADTPDKLVYGKMARVVDGISRVIAELAGMASP